MAVRVGGIEFQVRANTTQASQAFTTLGRAARGLQNNLRQTRTLFGGLNKNLRATAASITGFAAALGAARVARFTREAVLLAARVENLGTVLANVGRIAGLNVAQIRNIEDSVKSLGITTRSARQSLAQLAQANLDLRKASQLTRIAQDAAVIAGIDSSEAFNRLTVSVQRNDVRLLRNLGIVINLNQVYAKFAQQTGRTAASLTAFEKRQLLLNEVIARGAQITGTYEASLRDSFKQFTSLRRLTEEAVRTFGEQFIPVFEKAVKVTGDWLKAFAEGRTAIGPRFLGVVAAATIALGAFATVVAGVAATLGAVAIAGGPVTLALAALGVAIAGGVALWADYELSVIEAAARLEEVEDQAEQTAQALFEGSKIIQEISEIDRPFGNAAEEIEQVKVAAAELAVLFPELADRINEVAQLESPRELVRTFEILLPEALESTEKQIELFGERRVQAEEKFQQALLRTFEEQEGITEAERIRINSIRFQLGELAGATVDVQEFNDAAARAQRRFNKEIAQGSEEFIKLNPLLVSNVDDLRKFSDQILSAERAIVQLRQARLSATFQEFQEGLNELEQSGNQAVQIISKLESQRDRIFKETNLGIVRDFEAAQAQLVAAQFTTEEEILAARRAFAEAQNNEAEQIRADQLEELERNRRAQLVTEEEFVEQRRKILIEFSKTQQRIEAQGQALVESGLAALENAAKATELATENAIRQLERQEAVTARILEQARLEAEGIGPRLLTIRSKFVAETERLTKVNEELERSLSNVQRTIIEETGLTATTLRDVVEGALDPRILAPKARQLVERFVIVQRAIRANQQELLAREASFNQQFLRERERLSNRLIKEQERLNKELLQLQGEDTFRESTVEGLRGLIKAFEQGAQDTKDFVRETQAEFKELGEVNARIEARILRGRFKTVDEFDRALERLRRNAVPGIRKVRDEFEKFRDAAQKATTARDLSQIEKLFGERLTDRIRQSQVALQRLKVSLEEFRRAGRPEQERENRIENQRLFNELVDQGVPILKAREEIARREAEQRKKLNEQEKELERGVKEARNAERELLKERQSLEQMFTETVSKQTAEIERQVGLRKQLVELQQQEIANIQQQLQQNRRSQQVLGEFAEGGLRGATQRRAGEQAPPAPTGPGGTAQQMARQRNDQLVKQTGQLVTAAREETRIFNEGLQVTLRSLTEVRRESDARIRAQEQWIADRTSELEAGKQKMRQAELIRKKR